MRTLARVDGDVEPMSERSEAEQLCLEQPPDVLLIDLWPGHSADLELAVTLKLTRPGAKVALLAREQVVRSSVADAVVAVPFSPSRLFDVISALVHGQPL